MKKLKPLVELLEDAKIGDLVRFSFSSGKQYAGFLTKINPHKPGSSKIADVYFSDESPNGDPTFILKIEKADKNEENDNTYYKIID